MQSVVQISCEIYENPSNKKNVEIQLREYSDQAKQQADSLLRFEAESVAAIAEWAATRAYQWSEPYDVMLDPIPFVKTCP